MKRIDFFVLSALIAISMPHVFHLFMEMNDIFSVVALLSVIFTITGLVSTFYQRRSDLLRPKPPTEIKSMDDVRMLIDRGHTVDAITGYQVLTGVSWKEARDAVELMDRETFETDEVDTTEPPVSEDVPLPYSEDAQLIRHIDAGEIPAAIKRLRELTQMGVVDATRLVQDIQAQRKG